MKNRATILKEFEETGSGGLVLTGKMYREKFFDLMTEAAFAQAVSRLCRSGAIARVSKGVYCSPQKSRFGTVIPSEREIVELFTDGSSGVLVGYGLYNALGVTTQISKRQTVYSSVAEEQLKQIGNVTIRKFELEYTPEVKSVIRLMELLHHFKEIQDINMSCLLSGIERLAGEFNEEAFDTVQKAIGYPKWTIAFLREVLNYNGIPNNLGRYLSALTNYPIPKMEDLYETA